MGHTFLEENEIKKARAEERARAAAIIKDLMDMLDKQTDERVAGSDRSRHRRHAEGGLR